jgi:hypothetical protein
VKRYVHIAAIIVMAMPSLVCAQQPASSATVAGASDMAARVGDRVITVAELDEAWRQADAAAQAQAAHALYEGRKQALDRLLADHLIAEAAKARGVSSEQFTKDEIARRTKPVAESDVETFYQQNVSRMQGKPLTEMRGMIRRFLEEQRQATARSSLVSELRKAGPPVVVALDPPRQKVEVASTDPSRGGQNAAVVLVEYSDYQ